MTPIRRPECPPELRRELERLASKVSNAASPWSRLLDRKLNAQLRSHLSDLFEHRCCYCESPLGGAATGEIERFRPHSGSASNDGRFAAGQYAQLAFEWRNLYLACPVCNRNKANRFPLDGPPALPGLSYDEIVSLERPMLLDPCRDDPDEHLVFQQDGTVSGLTERGAATIEVLGLNRSPLVAARLEQVKHFELARLANKFPHMPSHPAVWRQLRGAMERPDQAALRTGEAKTVQARLEAVRSEVSTEDGLGLENYRARACYIDRIIIENVGPIRRLELTPADSISSQGPCFALLGENGVGKSTVLKAIALAMSGENYSRRLRISSKHLLSVNALEGEVRIKTSDGREDIVMSLRRRQRLQFNLESSRALVIAYGATRLLPRGRHKPKPGLRHAKIDNLFNPFLPLADAAAWLESLDEQRLQEVNRVLAQLLPGGSDIRLILDGPKRTLRVQQKNEALRSIYELSDGYQSMLAMTVDILEVMTSAGFQSMESAQGIVLVDEMGNHFHPAWRLRALAALRKAFPCVQFIYSTHDPLCLRGLMQGEVAVLRRDRLGSVYALDDLPAVERLRVEQLLTSEHFGLQSTVDPDLQEKMERYESLIRRDRLSVDEEDELAELTEELTDSRFLGATRRERMLVQLLEMEDTEAAVPPGGTVSAEQLSHATVTKLRRVMREITPAQKD